MKRCIIYARIGGPASEVNNSLMQAQLAGLRTTAEGLGLEVVAELPVFEYGTNGNRQSIKTLARDRRHGLYECVLMKNLSRLARGEAILEVGRKFASAGLSVYTPSGGNVKKCAVGKYPKSEKPGGVGQAACCACAHSRYLTGGSPSGLRV